jgi:serine/threonine protein kinase
VHGRDLKPENILLADKRPGQPLVVKLADFGIATIVDGLQKAQTYCGTPHYFAPEVHQMQRASGAPRGRGRGGRSGAHTQVGPGYAKPSDLWSVGVIVYVMLSGIPPFDDSDLANLVRRSLTEVMLGLPVTEKRLHATTPRACTAACVWWGGCNRAVVTDYG